MLAWVATVALLLQGLVGAAHHHGDRTGTPSLTGQGAASITPPSRHAGDADGCPVCRALGSVAQYLAPSPVVLAAAAPVAAWSAPAREARLAVSPHWHGWRSRAPPLSSRS